jgi:hypothetical protein
MPDPIAGLESGNGAATRAPRFSFFFFSSFFFSDSESGFFVGGDCAAC